MTRTYEPPALTLLGTVADLTGGTGGVTDNPDGVSTDGNSGTGPATGSGFGKGSVTFDGKSGMIGNRSEAN